VSGEVGGGSSKQKKSCAAGKPGKTGKAKATAATTDKSANALAALMLPDEAPFDQLTRALNSAAEAISLRGAHLPNSLTLVRFQLQHMPHLLERPVVDATRDLRVDGFVPDAWQRKLLDVVDSGAHVCVDHTRRGVVDCTLKPYLRKPG
jgi:hypothetical protein